MISQKLVTTATATTIAALILSANVFAQTSPEASESKTGQTPRDTFDPYPALPVSPQSSGSQLDAPPAPVVDSGSSDYLWILNQVRLKRQQAMATLRAQQQATANQNAANGDEHRKIHELRRNYEDQDSQLQNREERVNQQLDRLERLLKEHEVLNQTPSTPIEPDAGQSSPRPTPDQTVPAEQQTDPQPSQMTTKPISDQASDSVDSSTETPQQDPDTTVPSVDTAPPFSPTQVEAIALTNQTVNSLALANNLYGTGEYSLALKIYSKVDQTKMQPEDKIWIRFQVANCQRQLGNFKEAHRGYRIVTSAAGDSWVGKTAHWWLVETDRTTRLKNRIKNLQASYEQLRKEVDEPIEP